jgi:hypothetical protein
MAPFNHTSQLVKTDLFYKVSLPDLQKLVNNSGKHTACGEQHELTMHTDVIEAQLYVTLLHGSKIEQRIPGAQ